MYLDHSGELIPIMSRWAPGVPAPAALAGECLADVVPDLLGVDQHAVHVEDDGLLHTSV